jgi:hypothetical protein
MEKTIDRFLSLLVPSKSNSRFGLSAQKQKDLIAYFSESNTNLSACLNMALEQFNYPMLFDGIEKDAGC